MALHKTLKQPMFLNEPLHLKEEDMATVVSTGLRQYYLAVREQQV